MVYDFLWLIPFLKDIFLQRDTVVQLIKSQCSFFIVQKGNILLIEGEKKPFSLYK